MVHKVYAAAAFIFGLTLTAPAAHAATDPQTAFDHDARCVISSMWVMLKTQDDPNGLLNPLIMQIYSHKMQIEGKALGYSPQDIQTRMQQAMQSFLGTGQDMFHPDDAKVKAIEASFGACQTDLVAGIRLAPVAVASDQLQKNYDADATCLAVYTFLPDRDDRSIAFLIGDAPVYLKRFQADTDALGKTVTQRTTDLQSAKGQVWREADAGFKPGQVLSEQDSEVQNDRLIARAQTCAAALKVAE